VRFCAALRTEKDKFLKEWMERDSGGESAHPDAQNARFAKSARFGFVEKI
jgi:hypothetical protein